MKFKALAWRYKDDTPELVEGKITWKDWAMIITFPEDIDKDTAVIHQAPDNDKLPFEP